MKYVLKITINSSKRKGCALMNVTKILYINMNSIIYAIISQCLRYLVKQKIMILIYLILN